MKYSKCKFKVEEPFRVETLITGYAIDTKYYCLFPNGKLLVKYGYTWDGATGAFDSKSILKASCVHDIFCELINAGLLPKTCQKLADKGLVKIMVQYWEWARINGCFKKKAKENILRPFNKLRQMWVYRAVRIYQENKITAPKKIILEVP